MPLFRKQSAAKQTSLAPHDSKARLRVVTKRRDSWRSHVHRTYTAHFYKMGRAAADNRSRGKSYRNANAALPRAGNFIPEAKRHSSLRLPIKSLSLGVPKGPFSFAKENGPFDLHPCAVAGTPLPHSAGVSSILLINRQPKRQFDTKLLSLLSFLLILGPRLIIVRRHAEQR